MSFFGHAGHPGLISVLLLFFALHLVTGFILPFRGARRPFLWDLMQSAAAEIDRRLNRDGRSDSEKTVRGVVALSVMTAFGYLIGAAVDNIAHYTYGWLAQFFFLTAAIGAMLPVRLLRRMAENPKDPKALGHVTADDIAGADAHTLARRAVEFSAIALCQYLVAPALAFAFFGARGAGVYIAVMAVFNVAGMADPRHLLFGGAARAAEAVVNFIPARATMLLVALAGIFVARANPWRGLSVAFSQAGGFRPRHHGLLLATVAGVLNIALGGPIRTRRGDLSENKWLGPKAASAKLTSQTLQSAALLHLVCFLCLVVIFSFILIARQKYS